MNNLYKIKLNKNEKFVFKNDSNVMCIGFFDGIHSIHSDILNKTKDIANELNMSASVFTFEKKIGKTTFQIMPNKIKYEKINELISPDYIFEMEVNTQTKSTTYSDFLNYLIVNLNVRKVVVGSDIRFGSKAIGDLKSLIEAFGKDNVIIFERENDFSSTQARDYLLNYDFKSFKDLMNYDFELYLTKYDSNKYIQSSEGLILKDGVYECKLVDKNINIEIKNGIIKSDFELNSLKIIKLIKEF